MAMAIIDALEMVDIKKNHGQWRATLALLLNKNSGLLHEGATIESLGQGVKSRGKFKFGKLSPTLGCCGRNKHWSQRNHCHPKMHGSDQGVTQPGRAKIVEPPAKGQA